MTTPATGPSADTSIGTSVAETYGRIETEFRAKRDAGRKLLVPFITGGVTEDYLAGLESR